VRTAIESVEAAAEAAAEAWHSIDGTRTRRPVKGRIYIIRKSDGTTSKTLIR